MSQELMRKASEAYYDGAPFLSNEEYDALEKIYGQVIAGAGEVNHLHRMFSLQKHYAKDGEPPLNISKCVKSPKVDGAAISIVFSYGELNLALTRGDGIKGRPITDKVKLLVPAFVEQFKTYPLVQVTGEVCALSTVENSRNYASGALNLKSVEEFSTRVTDGTMLFIAYDTSLQHKTYTDKLELLANCGFCTVLNTNLADYPQDGIVYRLDDEAEYQRMGWTAKFPRGAFALKEEQESVTTTLLDVIWATGKSGKVTPTAILAPVMIGDASIARATLNNIAYIEALDLEIGCTVELVRAGEIIPKIIGRVYEN
jgi:NAD-dependent DNA ligase